MKLTEHGGSGPLVVKLAGIAGGTGLYLEEMNAAASAGYRVVALDTAGDRRDDPAPAPLSWDGLAAEIDAGIAQAGSDGAILWGTSFGCLVALAAAVRRPERVRGLLLCHPPDPLRRPRLYLAMMRWAGNRRRPDLAARLIFTAAFLSLTSWEGIGVKVWPRVPKLLGASFEAATPPATVRRKLDMLFSEDPGTPNGIPTEIVAGAWDLVAPLSGTRAVARKCDGARLAVMRWSGHAGAYSWPATYRRLVLEALERLSRPGLCYLRDR